MVDFDNQFAEESIGPREPVATVISGIVFVERFVHETRSGVSVPEHGDTFQDFFWGRARQCSQDDPHRPDGIFACMRARLPRCCGAL